MKLRLLLSSMLLLILASASFANDQQLFARGGGWFDGVTIKILDISDTDPGSSLPDGGPESWSHQNSASIKSFYNDGPIDIYVRVWIEAFQSNKIDSQFPILHINDYGATKVTKIGIDDEIMNGYDINTAQAYRSTEKYYALYKFKFNTANFNKGVCYIHATANYTPNSTGHPAASERVRILFHYGKEEYIADGGEVEDEEDSGDDDGDDNLGNRLIVAYEDFYVGDNLDYPVRIDMSSSSQYAESLKKLGVGEGAFDVIYIPTSLTTDFSSYNGNIMPVLEDLCRTVDFSNNKNGINGPEILSTIKGFKDARSQYDYMERILRDIPSAKKNRYIGKTHVVNISNTKENITGTRGITYKKKQVLINMYGIDEYIGDYISCEENNRPIQKPNGEWISLATSFTFVPQMPEYFRGNTIVHELGHAIGLVVTNPVEVDHCSYGESAHNACLMVAGTEAEYKSANKYNWISPGGITISYYDVYVSASRIRSSYDGWCSNPNHKQDVEDFWKSSR